MPDPAAHFRELAWLPSDAEFTISGWRFRVEQTLTEAERRGAGPPYFRFFKPRSMVEQYERLFAGWDGPGPRRVFELGIFDGGSAAFWAETLRPERYVAIDYQSQRPRPYLERYLASAPATEISLHYDTDQSDGSALAAVLAKNGLHELDVVIDDASHKYRQTVASFNALFPKLAPGGWYVIEDWGWCYDESFLAANPEWRRLRPLGPIVLDLAVAMSQHRTEVASLRVMPDFLVVERSLASTSPNVRLSAETRLPRSNAVAARRMSAIVRRFRRRRAA